MHYFLRNHRMNVKILYFFIRPCVLIRTTIQWKCGVAFLQGFGWGSSAHNLTSVQFGLCTILHNDCENLIIRKTFFNVPLYKKIINETVRTQTEHEYSMRKQSDRLMQMCKPCVHLADVFGQTQAYVCVR